VRDAASAAIRLRNETLPSGIRSSLWAWVDECGDLHLDAQDLGVPPGLLTGDGEYEYDRTVAAEYVPALVALLGGEPGADVLALLARDWAGPRSFDLELRLREAPFPIAFSSW